MNDKSVILRNAMNFGAITGFASAIYTFILYSGNLMFSQGLNIISYIIIIAGIYIGTKHLRDKYEEGLITYSRALFSGILICFFASIIMAFFNFFLYTYIDPDLMEKSFTFLEEKLLQQGRLTEEQIELLVQNGRENSNVINTSIMSIPVNTIVGLILSIFVSAFVKKEKQILNN